MLSTLSVIFYLTSAIVVGYCLKVRLPVTGNFRLFYLATNFGGMLIQLLLLQHLVQTENGLRLDVVNMFLLVTWLMVVMLILGSIQKPLQNLNIIIAPLAALSVLLAAIFHTNEPRVVTASTELQSHILLSVIAFSLLSIAAIQAILLAVQERHLRNHQPNGFIQALPPMESMESLLFEIIWLGFISLTLALFNGLLYLEDMFAQHLVHKTVLSISAWLVFSTLLWGRWRFGWRGKTAIRWTLIGLFTLLLAYFGSKIVIELILS
ncbi:MAG: cytochrome c biogenesis protein CcsA [Gammaproteobacteria bacterium]|nr:cytochrome c biogenesis protein CcsA [Gammaproteobacteria bacterium]